MTGLIKGLAKGMMGTVSRAIIGALDLTNDKATHALDSSARRVP